MGRRGMAQVFNYALLLKARLELDLTQEQVASAAGVDVRTYRRYESGAVNDPRHGFSVRHPTRRRMIERLSAELGVSEAELLVDMDALPRASAPESEAALGPSLKAEGAPPHGAAGEGAYRPLFAHTLQRARHFVGREGVLDRLQAWLAEPRPKERVIALVAVGGTGKTATIERAAASLGDAPREGGVFVWSFYEDPKTEAFLEQALRYFARSGDASPGERLARLEDALRQGPPHILVLDGLETVQAEGGAGGSEGLGAERGSSARSPASTGRAHGELNDALLRRLLCAVTRGLGGTRALITSRFELADIAAWEGNGLTTIRLAALSPREGSDLLRAWGIAGGDRALSGLVANTGGHALSLAMIGSYVGAFLGGDPSRFDGVDLEAAARDDVLARRLSAVLGAYARALSQEERDLLARLSVFPGGAGEEALLAISRAGGSVSGSLAGWGAPELHRSLARLERLGLVFSARGGDERARDGSPRERAATVPEGRGYSTHPFVRQYFKSLLGVSPERIWEVQGASPPPRLDTAPHSLPRDRALLDGYEALFGHMLEVGRPLDAYRIYSRSMGGFGHIGLRAGEMSRGARMMRALAAGDDPARMPVALTASVRGALVYDWGLYAGALGDLAFACRCYATYIEIVEEQGPSAELATGLRTLAYTERLRGELAAARGHIERSAAVAEEAGEVEHRVRAIALLASVLHDMGEVDEAAAHFEALHVMRLSPVARRGLWEAEHNLALGRREAAREATTHNLEVCSRLGWVGHVAHCHTVLGLLSAGEDEGAARQHLARARTWVGATGEVEVALRCYELAARIELAAGRLEEGARQADDGLRTAEACGFALWRTRLAALMAQCVLEDPSRAASVVSRALAAAAEDDAWGRADALHWAGVAFARAGERARASALLGDASALRARIKHPGANATAKELEGLSRRAERAARRR